MARNVTLRWELPTERTGGGALPPDEIQHTRVELSADGGANFGDLGQVAPTDPQLWQVPELEAGNWQFRLTVVDTLGQASAPHIETVNVKDETPPNPVTNVTSEQV